MEPEPCSGKKGKLGLLSSEPLKATGLPQGLGVGGQSLETGQGRKGEEARMGRAEWERVTKGSGRKG